ncbi:MAG: magnesium protoporphyrin IX methyltransferase [Pseudohongiellaceae bacterium]
MPTSVYEKRRGQLRTYFDETAVAAWDRLTSDAPVGRIRQTVRAGRDRMRDTLLSWLPADMRGKRLLDAGCGTGALSVEAARRGAEVIAIDLSPTLIELARERTPTDIEPGRIEYHSGDMLDAGLGRFDYVVAMDSLIHYPSLEVVATLASLAERTGTAMLFTFAPRTPALMVMHSVGKLFPSGNRSPAIEPAAESTLRRQLAGPESLRDWETGRTQRIDSGFYKSQALEIKRA